MRPRETSGWVDMGVYYQIESWKERRMSSTMENEAEYSEKLTPIEKLISSDRLTYLPNLYYRQYRCTEILNHLRTDFPAQKVLLPRPTTTHDHMLEQAKTAQFELTEEIKFRKAVCFHLAKSAKEEYTKWQYKKEERYLFQRVVYSQLAEAVRNRFKEEVREVGQKKNGAEVVEPPKPTKQQKRNDGVFIDENESDIEQGMDDLFGDILQDPIDRPNQELQEQEVITTTRDYMARMIAMNRGALVSPQSQINRKQCLKKINQNVRKRNKAKYENQNPERKLASATVSITGLISQQPENKPEEMIELPSENENLTQETRKKKKEEHFELKWGERNLEDFGIINSKFDITKGKFEENYLSLHALKNEKDYERVFDKNIHGSRAFPPSLDNIPTLASKFSSQKFYNELSDPYYERFIISHSKKKIFEKFSKAIPFVLSDAYRQEYQGDNINLAKLFINHEGPYSDRIIYKLNNNRLTSVSSLPQRSPLSREQLSQLAYFVRKYLGLFGSNWKLIHLFISIHPSFSKMSLSREQIQELHQIPKHHSKNSLATLQLLDSKVLPFGIYNSFGYDEFTPEMKPENIEKEGFAVDEESQEEDADEFNFDKYESLLDEPLKVHEMPKEYALGNIAKDYEEFARGLKFPLQSESRNELVDEIEDVIGEFESKKAPIEIQDKDSAKVTWCFEWVPEKLKNKIKPITPFRKRKSISEKFSELVGLLHRFKQKIQPSASQTTRTPPPPMIRAPSNIDNKSIASNPNVPEPSISQKKMLPRPKDPVTASKDKPAPPKSRKPKKKDGKDDDDK